MPLVGPTPVDWINQRDQRKDEQLRMMMQMALADRQFQQQQRQQDRQYEEQVYRDSIAQQRADAWDKSLTEPRPTGPTELERNFGFLQGQYPGQDVGPMIVPGLKPGQGSEGYQYDIDPTSAAEMEKEFRLPAGAVSQMGPRQREDAFTQFQNRRFPRPDTNTPAGQTAVGRQAAYLNTMLQDFEQRRAAAVSQSNTNQWRSPETFNSDDAKQAISGLESKITVVRGALSRITSTGQPIPESEWKAMEEQLRGKGEGNYSPMAMEIAQEMGISPEMADAYIKKAMGTPQPGVGLREK